MPLGVAPLGRGLGQLGQRVRVAEPPLDREGATSVAPVHFGEGTCTTQPPSALLSNGANPRVFLTMPVRHSARLLCWAFCGASSTTNAARSWTGSSGEERRDFRRAAWLRPSRAVAPRALGQRLPFDEGHARGMADAFHLDRVQPGRHAHHDHRVGRVSRQAEGTRPGGGRRQGRLPMPRRAKRRASARPPKRGASSGRDARRPTARAAGRRPHTRRPAGCPVCRRHRPRSR